MRSIGMLVSSGRPPYSNQRYYMASRPVLDAPPAMRLDRFFPYRLAVLADNYADFIGFQGRVKSASPPADRS
jgi:hypothetical protein